MHIGKEEVHLSLIADDLFLFTEVPKDRTRKLLELISEFKQSFRIKSTHRNHLHFYILTMKNQKEKLRNRSHSPLQQKELNI